MVIHSQRCLPDTTPWGTPPPRGRPGPLSARSAPFSAPSIAAGVAVWSLEVEPDHMTPTPQNRPARTPTGRLRAQRVRSRVHAWRRVNARRRHRDPTGASSPAVAPVVRLVVEVRPHGQDDPMALSHV